MNQHHIQEAYFKNFTDSGLVWVAERNTGKVSRKPPSWCTSEQDFQSDELEKFQNKNIETPGIRKIRDLISSVKLNEEDIIQVHYWVALHIIRSQKLMNEIYQTKKDFKTKFKDELEKEFQISSYFRFADIFTCNKEDRFITSDNPIIEFTIEKSIVRLLVLNPKKILYFSPIDRKFCHDELNIVDLVNSMIWISSFKYLFSNSKIFDIALYKKNAKNWGMEPQLENMKFKVEQNL